MSEIKLRQTLKESTCINENNKKICYKKTGTMYTTRNYPNKLTYLFNINGNSEPGIIDICYVYIETDNYNNSWDGTINVGIGIGGNELPTGTYFYIFDTKDPLIGENGIFQGYIYLQR